MKNYNFKKIVPIWMLIFFLLSSVRPWLQAGEKQAFLWTLGEKLSYKVKWSFVRLGTVRLYVLDSLEMDQCQVFHTRLYIDSNPLLFFVNMHSVYESYIDKKYYPHLFIADEKIEGVTYKTRYRFDYVERIIDVNMTDMKDTNHVIIKRLPLDEKVQDGMSLIFYARGNVRQTKQEELTAFIEAKKGKLQIRFKGDGKQIKIDAVEHPLDTYEVDGQAHFTAIAGFNGKYRGWFAADPQFPPLKAELKVFLGNVHVELESWEKWKPRNHRQQLPKR
ncbi:DUF3108 domain-containing protein [candidate division KSB1 bacterium]|nr:DUF3108 domain-containing protein [candidate division KSB1 bacterium]